MESYKRAVRVGELIQHEISKIVQELKEPGLGFITITGVKLTDDLKSARVFYSIIGDEKDKKINDEILKNVTPFIRHMLAVRVNLRYTPTIEFNYDDTPERATRIFEILEKIKKEESLENPNDS
ncbi:MAG: 30S ribosome-binding factor RbfA [Elusimicrobia bacterium]|nr:30S ribosome-binding factor RbfA [Candidatus Liberimonas magnetica]